MSYVEDMFGLDDKVIVITGAGGVIAGALTEAFVKAGAKVSLWEYREDAIAGLKQKFGAMAADPSRVHALAVDTGNREAVLRTYAATEAALGRPNILVNAVGGNRGKCPFVEADPKAFEDIIKLNLIAGLLVPTQVFASEWIRAGAKGSIINFASMGSYIPLSGVWAYDAAKAGVLNLTVACAKEFGGAGIRVNALAPGFFIGQQNKALLIANETTGELTARGQDIIRRTPFGRFGNEGELKGVALFLASDRASGFVTGACIPVDGGFLADNI
jgi:NAD(P)-dependent dehydrogenase (short-subunit alcohol dehydrogenase family)